MDIDLSGGDYFQTSIKLDLGLVEGTLIDFETTGVPRRDEEHEVITLGYFCNNSVVIIQRISPEKEPFYSHIRNILMNLPTPFYAYNAEFERNIMRIELGLNYGEDDFIDLMEPWRKKADRRRMKWPKLDDLISEPEDYFKEGKISGKDIPGLWKAYLHTKSEGILELIMNHCLSDILREIILILRYSYTQNIEDQDIL